MRLGTLFTLGFCVGVAVVRAQRGDPRVITTTLTSTLDVTQTTTETTTETTTAIMTEIEITTETATETETETETETTTEPTTTTEITTETATTTETETETETTTEPTTTTEVTTAITTETETTTTTEVTTTTETGRCTTPSLCPPLSTAATTLNFDDDPDLSTDYKSPFSGIYKSFTFSPGWLLLNGLSPLAGTFETLGIMSPPNALLSSTSGMQRFGSTNFTFDLLEFSLLGWTREPAGPLILTIRTDKMGGEDAFPYALPFVNGRVVDVRAERAMGELLKGVRWVEMAVWKEWRYEDRPGVNGVPATGWIVDNLVVTRRQNCGERGTEWEELKRRGIVW
jgi:hypothetical protein